MRAITQDSVDAFLGGYVFKKANMDVVIRPWQDETQDSVIMQLHGNPIARYNKRIGVRDLRIRDGGWQTNTTKERLNGLPGVWVNQNKGAWFLNGQLWDGEWTQVCAGYTLRLETGEWRVDHPTNTGLGPLRFVTKNAAQVYISVQTGSTKLSIA